MTATIEPWLRAILRSPGGQHRLIDHDGPDGPELACPALGIGVGASARYSVSAPPCVVWRMARMVFSSEQKRG